MRDWIGRCLKSLVLLVWKAVRNPAQLVLVLLFCAVPSLCRTRQNVKVMTPGLLTLSHFQDFLKGPFSSTYIHIKHFIAISILSFGNNVSTNGMNSRDVSSTSEAMASLVT